MAPFNRAIGHYYESASITCTTVKVASADTVILHLRHFVSSVIIYVYGFDIRSTVPNSKKVMYDKDQMVQ